MISELISVPGYQKLPKDEQQFHIRFAVHHQGRIWVMGYSAKTDKVAPLLPETGARLSELAYLGFFLLRYVVATMMRQATNRFGARLCQLDTDALHHGH
ncbi:MAG: hypothetical protein ACR65R_00425 [Methylomicrobium sp.]